MRTLALALLLGLAGCGGSNSPPQPPVPPLPQPAAGWAITEGSMGFVPLADPPSISLPQCASASICWISYVEKHTGTALTGKDSLLLSYEITGDNPSFVNDSPNNTCGGAPTLSLLIHQLGDTGFAPSMRWFSQQRQTLAIGAVSWAVPLMLSKWINVNGQSTDQAGFDMALAAQGSIGLVLGGGCFAGHGVAVSAGSANLNIVSFEIR